MTTVIMLPFPPSVNHLYAGKSRRYVSKAYEAWIAEARFVLNGQTPLPQITGPVNLSFHFGRPDKRKRDVFNYVKAPEDFLVANKIIEDDSLVEKGTVEWAPNVCGVVIEITPYKITEIAA